MFIDRFQQYIEKHRLLKAGDRVMVGLSGGVDSVVLTHLLHALGYGVEAAHVNYQLRGSESDRDELFVRTFCDKQGIPLHPATFDTHEAAREEGLSIQETARRLRYQFFDDTARMSGIRTVAVAHHRDDQVETVLLNLFRGTGLEGLAGMPVRRPIFYDSPVALIRPLLTFSRDEIESYARSHGLQSCVDTTNEGVKYRRSALRNEILPTIERYFGTSVRAHIFQSSEGFRELVDEWLRPARKARLHDVRGTIRPRGGSLDTGRLKTLPVAVRKQVYLEALHRWVPRTPATSVLLREIDALTENQPGRKLVVPFGTIWKERDELFFDPDHGSSGGAPDDYTCRLTPGADCLLPVGILRVEVVESTSSNLEPTETPWKEIVDADRLQFPLTVRKWRQGDRFRPLGMTGRKKLSDFLTDQRVSPSEKADVLVVLSGSTIVWVAGQRISEDVRVRTETVRFAKITFNRAMEET